jgi:hypothetical protein
MRIIEQPDEFHEFRVLVIPSLLNVASSVNKFFIGAVDFPKGSGKTLHVQYNQLVAVPEKWSLLFLVDFTRTETEGEA